MPPPCFWYYSGGVSTGGRRLSGTRRVALVLPPRSHGLQSFFSLLILRFFFLFFNINNGADFNFQIFLEKNRSESNSPEERRSYFFCCN